MLPATLVAGAGARIQRRAVLRPGFHDAMTFDTLTLMMAGSITTALAGLALFGVWTQLRHETALLWWFAANIVYAAGIAFLAAGLPDNVIHLVVAGTLLSDVALPLLWIGARVFNRRPTPVRLALPVGLAWPVASLAIGMMQVGLSFSFTGWAVWLSVSAFELWRGRAERIPARWPLIAFFMIHAAVYAGGVHDALAGRLPRAGMAPLNSWFGAIFFEEIVFAMASAIVMTMLCKERDTQEYMRAARNDSLTGIANHGALMEGARRIFQRCRKDGAPFSLIMFDLDHFKAVNDRHGHRAGDDILRGFADTVRGLLRPTDLFGRYGGEEFTMVLPGATIDAAYVIAERIRHAFDESHRFLHGRPLNATVSAGVAAADTQAALEDVLDAADQALYRAKDGGRNRVERADTPRPADAHDTIVRIA
jgi:diguanylate cyclase (GGDEF)-like protein